MLRGQISMYLLPDPSIIAIWDIDYFMESARVRIYARVVGVSENDRVSVANEWVFWYKNNESQSNPPLFGRQFSMVSNHYEMKARF